MSTPLPLPRFKPGDRVMVLDRSDCPEAQILTGGIVERRGHTPSQWCYELLHHDEYVAEDFLRPLDVRQLTIDVSAVRAVAKTIPFEVGNYAMTFEYVSDDIPDDAGTPVYLLIMGILIEEGETPSYDCARWDPEHRVFLRMGDVFYPDELDYLPDEAFAEAVGTAPVKDRSHLTVVSSRP